MRLEHRSIARPRMTVVSRSAAARSSNYFAGPVGDRAFADTLGLSVEATVADRPTAAMMDAP